MLLEGLNSESIWVDAKYWSDLKKEALARLESRKKSASKK